MNCRSHAVGLSLVAMIALGSGAAFGQSRPGTPLRLKFASPHEPAAAPAFARAAPVVSVDGPLVAGNGSAKRRGPRFQQMPPTLSQRALQSLLDNAELDPAPAGLSDQAMFRFERRGSAGRDLSQGYKDMCENATQKLWDEPNGKRLKFDIAGKPGVAIIIPLR